MPNRIIKKISIPSHIIKLQGNKDQEKVLKAVREKACTAYQRKTIECQWISHQNPHMPEGSGKIFCHWKMLKERAVNQEVYIQLKISFMKKGEIKPFSDEEWRECVTSRPTLQEWLRKFPKQKENDRRKKSGTSRRKKEDSKQKYGWINRLSFSSWAF